MSTRAEDHAGSALGFALAALATWRVTHLVTREDGPADAVVRVRARAGHGLLGQLMDCFYCLSMWVAAPLAMRLTRRPGDRLVAWLALSGAACLLERMRPEPLAIHDDPTIQGDDHELLWQEAKRDDAGRSVQAP
jgi:hypothetical protein